MIRIKLLKGSRASKDGAASKTTINVQGQTTSGVPASFVDTVRQWFDSLAGRVNNLWTQCLSYFLRRDIDDTANGHITLAAGLTAHKGASVDGGLSADSLDVATDAIIRGQAVFSPDGSFASGLTGHGARILDGAAEMDALTLRHFLEVPELRYNRVSVLVGNQWRAPGGGVIRSVFPNADGTGGTACLKLEKGEIGAVSVGDICMGIYHSTTPADNATANADDNRGNFRFAGFYTAYWKVVAVRDYTDPDTGVAYPNGAFSYECRPVSGRYPRQFHPAEAMHFVCYGNASDTARQSSRYSTLTYERFIEGVTGYEFGSANIRMQVGDLSGFTPAAGVDFTGYSVYCNNIYMSGYLQQLADIGDPSPYTYSVDNLADTVPVDSSGNLKQPLITDNADGSQSWLLHSSIQVRKGQSVLTVTDGEPTDGEFSLSCVTDGCEAHFDHSTLYIDSVEYQTRKTASVEVTMNCEGKAALTYQFTIKIVRDGEKGEQGQRGTSHGIRYRYAISAEATTPNASTAPSDIDTAAWGDTPRQVTTTRPYLWMEQTPYSDNGETMSLGASSYVRLTGDKGARGEDGLNGSTWKMRGRAAGHVATASDLPDTSGLVLITTGSVYLIDSYSDGVRGAVMWTGRTWMSVTVSIGDFYLVGTTGYMAGDTDTNKAWVEVDGIQGPRGLQGEAGTNGVTTRIFQTLTDGQTCCDGKTVETEGICYLDFYAVRSDSTDSGWVLYKCVSRYKYATGAALPPADSTHWRHVSINAGSAFFTFLLAKNARIDFMEGNEIRVRKSGETDYYAGVGGDFPFWAGTKYAYSLPSGDSLTAYTFAVDESGNLYANNAHLRGEILATSGTVGGFTINDASLIGTTSSSRGSVTLTPTLIQLQSGSMEDGKVILDTSENITAAISSGTASWPVWTAALQLTANNSIWRQGTALDIITGNTRGLRPETAFIGGTVTLAAADGSRNVPPITPSYTDGSTVAVRSGAVLLYDGVTTVSLPASPQDGDNYLLMPAKVGGRVTINAGSKSIIHSGGNDKEGTSTSFSTKDHRMVFIIFKGTAWRAKVMN